MYKTYIYIFVKGKSFKDNLGCYFCSFFCCFSCFRIQHGISLLLSTCKGFMPSKETIKKMKRNMIYDDQGQLLKLIMKQTYTQFIITFLTPHLMNPLDGASCFILIFHDGHNIIIIIITNSTLSHQLAWPFINYNKQTQVPN